MTIDWNQELMRFDWQSNLPQEAIEAMSKMRDCGKAFAQVIVDQVPDCADKTTAIRTIREAVYWANIAIAHEWPREDGHE